MSGLDRMKQRLIMRGGDPDGRIVRDKYKTFQGALKDSYQAEWITFNDKKWKCLINRDKLSDDYDQKEISIDFVSKMQEGSVFYWDRTKKYWLVSLQQYTEEAYFRGRIERCDYQITINEHPYWIYLRGPVETEIVWDEKHKINVNRLNYTLKIKVTKNEETDEFFKRFQILKFDNHRWQVNTVDRYSTQGILEVYLNEYYDNEDEENMILPEIITPDTMKPYINGPQIVHVFDENVVYAIENITSGEFVVNSNKVKIIESDENQCVLNIIGSKAGEFTLLYKVDGQDDVELLVHIESF